MSFAIAAAAGIFLLTLALVTHGWWGLIFIPIVFIVMVGVFAAFEGL